MGRSMNYAFLKNRGALNETSSAEQVPLQRALAPANLLHGQIPRAVVELIPESVARENMVMPLVFDGETITLAGVVTDDIALTDKLRFILGKNIRWVRAPRDVILQTIHRHYGAKRTESVDSMLQEFTDTSIDLDAPLRATPARTWGGRPGERSPGENVSSIVREIRGAPGLDLTPALGGRGMLFYTVEEGQRVLVHRLDGTVEVVVGPRRIWVGWKTIRPMQHFVAYPGKFLLVRFRDGQQQHLAGPADVWFDPRVHLEVIQEDTLQLAAKEAVVVYSKPEGSDVIRRRIVYGPASFVPSPGEWLHTFSWHASRGGSRGVQKEPNALVFQKLWLMPDQMYHDVFDVRTADDAVLTIRLMIFFELVDIERMLDTTHDPIGDFVNAATSDIVAFTGKHDFESFKRNTSQMNELETYRQLTGRASQCGYRINKVVYRGYGAAEALQQMHDQAIQARTRLQLDRATEQQAQELENFKLDAQMTRAGKRRIEQTAEVEHDLGLNQKRQEAEIRQREAQEVAARERIRLEAELQLAVRRGQDTQQREHLSALRDLSVDLTAYLTQARADRVIELRGAAGTHVHLDPLRSNRLATQGIKQTDQKS
jgi:hypothetical protein